MEDFQWGWRSRIAGAESDEDYEARGAAKKMTASMLTQAVKTITNSCVTIVRNVMNVSLMNNSGYISPWGYMNDMRFMNQDRYLGSAIR